MSKRSFKIDPNDRLHARSHSREPLHGVRSSENQFGTIKSPTIKGVSCRKKVKFAAVDKDSPFSLEASSFPSERKEVTTYADTNPKTSEYAFFKKLKKDAGQRFHSHSLQKVAHKSKKPEFSDCYRERTNNVRISSKDFSSSMSVENVTSVNSDLYLTPSDSRRDCRNKNISSMPEHLQGFGDTFQSRDILSHKGDQNVHGEIFSRKRLKLLQWIADTSFTDLDKICSKGHDIVSMLLNRILPQSNEESNEEKKVKDQNPGGGVVTASKYDLLASPVSDIEFKDCHQTPVRKLVEFESSSHSSDYLSSPMSNRSEERIISYTDFETNCSHKSQPWDSIREPDCIFGGTSSFNAKNDVTLSFMFNEYRSVSWNHLNDLGLIEREPNPDTLGEVFDGTKDEMNLPITYKSTKPDLMAPALLTSLHDGEEQKLDDMLGECRSSCSSLLPNQPQDLNSTLDSGLIRYQEYKFGKYAYGEKEDRDIDFNHASLFLSYNMDYLKPAEDCSRDISCIQDSIQLSPHQQWFRKVSNDYYHHPDTQAWLSSTLNFISRRRCLSLTSSCLDHQISNDGTLELQQKESVSAEFLAKNYYERDQDGENHREMLNHFREDMLEIYNSSFLHTSMERDNGYPLLVDGSDDINDQELIHQMLL